MTLSCFMIKKSNIEFLDYAKIKQNILVWAYIFVENRFY